MGYTVHHTISVTSWNPDHLREAHTFAVSVGASVSAIVDGAINGVATFVVAPDGSKEGWEASAAGDAQRQSIKAWLRSKTYGDGSTALRWFEVEHPEDGAPRVIDHQDRRASKSKLPPAVPAESKQR